MGNLDRQFLSMVNWKRVLSGIGKKKKEKRKRIEKSHIFHGKILFIELQCKFSIRQFLQMKAFFKREIESFSITLIFCLNRHPTYCKLYYFCHVNFQTVDFSGYCVVQNKVHHGKFWKVKWISNICL